MERRIASISFHVEPKRDETGDVKPPSDAFENQLVLIQEKMAKVQAEIESSRGFVLLGTIAVFILHELNNLLTPALHRGELALAKFGTPESREALERVVQSIDRAASVSRALMAMAKEDHRVPEPSSPEAPARVRAAIEGAVRCVPGDAARIHIDAGEERVAGITELMLGQVILNLVLNAQNALRSSVAGGESTPRGGEIRVCSTRNADRIRIEVQDTGKGIPPAKLEHLFEMFSSQDGFGLGLPLCKKIIAGAGGEISARSAPAMGTTVTISLRAA